MKGFAFLLKNILMLVLVTVGFISLYWAGILPGLAMQVLLNTLFLGLAMFIYADIMINASRRENQ